MGALSPRITCIVVMHYDAGQIRSFSLHTIAEQLNIPKDQVAANYDAIESRLLTDFYGFVKSTKDKYWVHWQMKSLTFGFEHLEHRYTYLTKNIPTPIAVENRINLVDCLRHNQPRDVAYIVEASGLTIAHRPMLALSRHVNYGDVHAGTIAIRSDNPIDITG